MRNTFATHSQQLRNTFATTTQHITTHSQHITTHSQHITTHSQHTPINSQQTLNKLGTNSGKTLKKLSTNLQRILSQCLDEDADALQDNGLGITVTVYTILEDKSNLVSQIQELNDTDTAIIIVLADFEYTDAIIAEA
jgi:hypothetical protein